MSPQPRLSETEHEALRQRYAALPDFDVVAMHDTGPEGLASPDAWELLEAEYRQRSLAGSEAEDRAEAYLETERKHEATLGATAPVLARLVQGSLDALAAAFIGFAAALCFAVVLTILGVNSDISAALLVIVFLALSLGYQVWFELQQQATPIMRQFGLRVVTTFGTPPGAVRLILRAVLRPVVMFGPLWYAVGRTWWGHDVLTGTRVVQINSGATSDVLSQLTTPQRDA